MNCSTPGLRVHHQLPEFTQTHVHQVSDAIQPSHPLSSPSPPAPNPSQHQSLFQWVNSSHEVISLLSLTYIKSVGYQTQSLTPLRHLYRSKFTKFKKQRHYFANKVLSSQGYGFSWMWELDCEESWALKNWCFWTVVLEKTLESPLDFKEIQPVHSKGDQSWVFFGRTDAKAETPILWPPHAKSWLIGKDPDARRDWGQEEKGRTEDEMAGWHHHPTPPPGIEPRSPALLAKYLPLSHQGSLAKRQCHSIT